MEFSGRDSIASRLLGKSQAIAEIRERLPKVARSDLTVLITGESGVGKTLVAEIIHNLSPRSSKEFIHLNCSNISPELFESELFGHERGAFTGAVVRKRGKIEVADGGTMFLDEIGDLHLNNQAKLLLFMDKGIFYRLGGTEKHGADVRFIAATNRNIRQEIKKGRFRQDLYFRLGVYEVNIPPLRERKEDIALLAEEILKRESSRMGSEKSLSSEALNKLLSYDWPGNVRELENVLKRAVIKSEEGVLKGAHVSFLLSYNDNNNTWPKKANYRMVRDTLIRCRGNKSLAAKELGISRQWLYKILRRN